MNSLRLDVYLVEKKLVRSRNVAKQLIEKGNVIVNNKTIQKANYLIDEQDIVTILENEKYVSRAAYKLLKAIDEFKLNLKNKVCIDIGASTGGFSQVLLENDVNKVYCIDVGINQLDQTIKTNKKIINLENTNFKDVDLTYFKEKIDFICVDVSFISIKHILEHIHKIKLFDFDAVILLKPQFEIGKKISKTKGLAKPNEHNKVIDNFKKWCFEYNFDIKGFCESPILGAKKNNKEFLFYLRKSNEI